MKLELWYLILGALLVVFALASSAVKQWPLTTTMLYLLTGVVLGPLGFGSLPSIRSTTRKSWNGRRS